MRLKETPEDFVVEEVAEHVLDPEGEYLLLRVEKRGMTSEEVAERIARACRTPRRAVGYAGAKDKHAVTRQFMSARFKGQIDLPGVEVLGQLREPISLGQLEGNRFEITVRDLGQEQLEPIGRIPNYYDAQRFSTQNARIGLAILKGRFDEATSLIASEGSFASARLQAHLRKRPTDYVGALRLVPSRTLLLYVHAYQSLLWNEVLTRYVRERDPEAVLLEGPVPMLLSQKASDIAIPVIGFDPVPPPFQEWYDELLARDGLTQRSFIVREIPFLTLEGAKRDAFVEPREFSATEREIDERHPGRERQTVRFSLPAGSYATIAVKCLYRTGTLG